MAAKGIYCRHVLLPEGWRENVRLVIEGGRISAIESAAQAGDDHAGIVVPGIANLHSHAFQRGMAGLAERKGAGDDSFWTWREMMYRFVERITPDDLEAIAAMAYVEMLESGFTQVCEFHYLHHNADGRPFADIAEMSGRIAAAAQATGIGLTLLPVFYAQGGFGGKAPGAAQRRFLTDVDLYARLIEACDFPGVTRGIAPHSLRAVSAEQLHAILPLAQGGPVHIHIAEQRREVEECLAFTDLRPVQYLFENFPVDERWCLVHATHISAAETSLLAKSGAVAGLCPITEANLGDGLFPLRPYLDQGGRFGVGSDSNVLIDLAEELRLLEYGQRLIAEQRNVAAAPGGSTGRALFDGALAGGALACGGMTADLVELDEFQPGQNDDWLDALVFAGSNVQSVWRGGRKVVTGGRHVGRDAVRAAFGTVVRKVLR